jgi:malic enzyme
MSQHKNYEWAVIGAGPAGIGAVGKLIDNGVNAHNIAWIDPKFSVGDFGSKWANVSSNTKVDLFIKFLNASTAFEYQNCKQEFALQKLDPEQTCLLKYAAEPLQWITQQLKKKIVPIQGWVQSLAMREHYWHIILENRQVKARNIILAQGSEPKTLPNYSRPAIIDLADALDPEHLKQVVTQEDVVAVFGASHSGIIAIRLLLEAGVKKVINFYQGPLRYAVYLEDWILFDNTGLKGETAKWAREHINGTPPKNLIRIHSSEENIQKYLGECTKAVHAVGFSRRNIPIEGFEKINYNAKSGIIALGLFGIGIAFPEETVDRFGNVELSVGLWKFMSYLERVVPVWLKYSN